MNFSTLKTRKDGATLFVALDNGPCNLMSETMAGELFALTGQLMTDQTTKVVVFESANPDFFIAHFDTDDIIRLVEGQSSAPTTKSDDINVLQGLGLTIQSLPQITIAKVDGLCRGGGFEFILNLDMRFASEGAKFCFPEASCSFLPAGSGTTMLPLIAGKARALEVILTGRDFSGKEAADYGFINCAVATKAELDQYVNEVVRTTARLDPPAVQAVKAVVKTLTEPMIPSVMAALKVENQAMINCLGKPETLAGFKEFTKNAGTPETELDLPKTIDEMLNKLSAGE